MIESYILALYLVESIVKNVCWVFFPVRVFEDKYCVLCDCLSFSDLLGNNFKRTLTC